MTKSHKGKKNTILIAAGAIVGVVALLLIVIAMRPSGFTVSRSVTIDAPIKTVFEQVNDLHKMDVWSPWLKPDPQAKKSFEGSPAGFGAIMSWDGNSDVGAGRMTIYDSRAYESIHIKLEFSRPHVSTSDVGFLFGSENGKTQLTWTISGQMSFGHKAISLVMSMDHMIGSQFEKGLGNLKKLIEKPSESEETEKSDKE